MGVRVGGYFLVKPRHWGFKKKKVIAELLRAFSLHKRNPKEVVLSLLTTEFLFLKGTYYLSLGVLY
jgi:hypothetical protein